MSGMRCMSIVSVFALWLCHLPGSGVVAVAQCVPGWSAMPGVNGEVFALTVWDPDGAGSLTERLVAGGRFTQAGTTNVARIASWDGTIWRAIGSGFSSGVEVHALVNHGGELIAAGWLGSGGSTTANKVSRWTGSVWTPMGNLSTYDVNALLSLNGELYAGGSSGTAGWVGRWNGVSWQTIGTFPTQWAGVTCLANHGDALLAAGDFGVQRWTGTSWVPVGSFTECVWSQSFGGCFEPPVVRALLSFQGDLFAGGTFVRADDQVVKGIARWDGAAWHGMGAPGELLSYYFFWDPDCCLIEELGRPRAFARLADTLFAGGDFRTSGGGIANGLAQWNDPHWAPLDNQSFYGVNALATYGNDLYVGGSFGGASAPGTNVARFRCANAPAPCAGDTNCDGAVTFADIDPFVARLGCPSSNPAGCNTGCAWQNADINADGAVTFADIDPFVGTLGTMCL